MEQSPIRSEIQRIIVDSLDAMGMTQRRFADEFPDYSTATYGTWRRQEVVMGLEVLEKILSKYPRLWYAVATYLGVNTEENLTSDFKMDNSKNGQNLSIEELLELYRNAYNNVMADLKERNKKISEQDARIKELEGELKKKVSKT